MKNKIIYQFRVELNGIEPTVWRQIEVPSNYSFWDFHIAIQDSMGWLDYHLHMFTLMPARKRKPIIIGIPDDEYEDNTIAGWDIPITKYFCKPGDEASYEYDFGDGWNHKVILEGIYLQKDGDKYPKCIDGKRRCPPEDCGGIPGYYRLIEVLSNPEDEEYKNMVYWLSNHAINFHPYKPEIFDPKKVIFCNPKTRWKKAFQNQ